MKALIKVSKLCDSLLKFERQGRYEDALSEIGDVWLDKTALPDTEGLSSYLKAELILRCGSIYGFFGHNKQIPGSQEKSRDLLTYARNLFLEIYDVEKISECENYLALTYWRTGEANEAKLWLEESFSRTLPETSDTRIYSHIIKSLVELSLYKPQKILITLGKIEAFILQSSDNCLKGAYYNQLGIAWDLLENVPKALHNLELAKSFYKKARHQTYTGVVCNDLALLYKTAFDFDKAHEMIDISTLIFKKIQDRTREGFSLDTKSQIFLAEKKYEEALSAIGSAISTLNKGENKSYVVESFKTKIKILISMNQLSAATFCLIEAVEIAKTKISEEKANHLVAVYENYLRNNFDTLNSATKSTKDSTLDNIELVLPSPLSNFEDIRGIWINNSHLEAVGLFKNSLAVIVPTTEVKRGDLIALEEIENQNVNCGFYDNDFGIVCLEGYDGEPLLFDEDKIRIIGKIVGVANDKTSDGKLIVEPI